MGAAAVGLTAVVYLIICVGNQDLFFQRLRRQMEVGRRAGAAFVEHDASGGGEPQIYLVRAPQLGNLGLSEYARLALGRENVFAMTVKDFEKADALGYYTHRYPLRIHLIYEEASGTFRAEVRRAPSAEASPE